MNMKQISCQWYESHAAIWNLET